MEQTGVHGKCHILENLGDARNSNNTYRTKEEVDVTGTIVDMTLRLELMTTLNIYPDIKNRTLRINRDIIPMIPPSRRIYICSQHDRSKYKSTEMGEVTHAMKENDNAELEVVLEKHAEVLKQDKDKTLVHTAVGARNARAVELLMKYGFSLLNKDNRGYQPLHLAAENGSTKIAEMLVSKLQSKSIDGM